MSEIDFEKYREYFLIDGDDIYIRDDFKKEIKNLKGKLHLVFDYFLSGSKNISNAYARKSEKECSYRYIPDDIRWSVWERDNFTCKKCGTRKFLSIDHIIPKSKGGETTIENCQTLCRRCNSKKGAKNE